MSKSQLLHKAKCIEKRTFTLDELPTMTAYLDAGMSPEELKTMLTRMYQKKVDNINTTLFCIVLMQQVKAGQTTSTIKFSKNWNNKLACPFYTTIRRDSEKYKVGTIYRVEINY